MKTMIRSLTFLLFTGLTLSAGAQWNSLVVFAPKGEKFTLYYNGDKHNAEPASRVQVDEVHGPTCKVRLVFETPSPEVSKTIFNKPSSTMYYSVMRNAKNAFVLQSASSEWSDVPAEEAKTKEAAAPQPAVEKDNHSAEPACTHKKECTHPMSDADFIAGLVSVTAPPFDPPKLSAAKKIAIGNCLTTTQIQLIMEAFDNESTRLNFAKFAYDNTWDRENYKDVGEALHSSSSRNELNKYISSLK